MQGPVNIFNADSEWSLPRSVVVVRTNGEYGFSVIGAAPVIIQSLDEKGPAKVRFLLDTWHLFAIEIMTSG